MTPIERSWTPIYLTYPSIENATETKMLFLSNLRVNFVKSDRTKRNKLSLYFFFVNRAHHAFKLACPISRKLLLTI